MATRFITSDPFRVRRLVASLLVAGLSACARLDPSPAADPSAPPLVGGWPYDEGDLDVQPRLLDPRALVAAVQREYPRSLRDGGVAGSAVVMVVVGPDGRVMDVTVVRSTHPALAPATARALRTLRFVPGQVNGSPVAVRVRIPVDWMPARS